MVKVPADVVLRAFSRWLDDEIDRRVDVIKRLRRLDSFTAGVHESEAEALYLVRRTLRDLEARAR